MPSSLSQSTQVESLAETVEVVLASLGPGDVLTYGELARLAGHPGAARAVGRVMSQSSGLPWWRVVNSQGRLVPGHERRQAELLRSEGIEVVNGRCPLRDRRGPHRTQGT
ncbi:MAG TPA: MGMT family protein [Candidatus Saccharimonadales bacterium]|nr:MGMT family protein [Candidatus Saccharimonadales bacterium]